MSAAFVVSVSLLAGAVPRLASANPLALVKKDRATSTPEARDALVEAEAKLASGELDAAAAAADRAIAAAPEWYVPYLTRDRIAEARARALGVDSAATAPAAGLDYAAAGVLLEAGRAYLAKAAELAPEDRKARVEELERARAAGVKAVASLGATPLPEAPAPAVTPPPTDPVPAGPQLSPEELERNKKISAEQKKANQFVVAGAVSAGILGPVLLISPLAFLVAKQHRDNEEDDTRAKNVGIATALLGGIGLAAGLTFLTVGLVKKKNAPKKFAHGWLRPSATGLEVAF